MKDDHHKVHKHHHKHKDHIHKKCRRKKERLRERSRSASPKRKRSSSKDSSSSSDFSKSRYRRNRSRSVEIVRRERSPAHRKHEREARIKYDDHRSANGCEDEVKREPHEDHDGQQGRPRGRRTDDEKPRWGRKEENDEKKPKENKAKPDFGLSGKLAEEVNTYKGVVIKYSEPAEARMPKRRWRLYPFKGDQPLPTLYVHRQSAYLIGRDRVVVDIPIDHPSCSKQHAVLQYRIVPYTRENGMRGNRIRPYIIDLDSANGTFVNNKKIEPRKYVELLEKDVIKFAFSSRDYVVLHEHSRDDDEDDNVIVENE